MVVGVWGFRTGGIGARIGVLRRGFGRAGQWHTENELIEPVPDLVVRCGSIVGGFRPVYADHLELFTRIIK